MIGDFIEKAGITVASIVGLLYVLRWLSNAHLAALNGRIDALETAQREKDQAIADRDRKIEKMHERLVAVMEVHAHDMQGIAIRMINESTENRKFQRDIHAVTVQVIEGFKAARPCMVPEYHPHNTPLPVKTDIPSVPKTDTIPGSK